MGYASVRNALVTFFSTVDQIQTMYREAPWIINGGDFVLNPGSTAAAVGFIHIDRSTETRITLPAINGTKGVDYTIGLVFLYKYMRPPVIPNGSAADLWVDGLDALIDALKAKIRSDPTAGAPSVIFQIGTGTGGGDAGEGADIIVDQDLPQDTDEGIFTLCRIEFHAYEIITA